MTIIRANAIDIEYEAIGPRDGPPMVLIMGLGMQLTAWPDDFCQGLASRGFRVIRFDNRDTGLSTKMPALGPLKATAMLAGATLRLPVRPRYDLNDMARDAIGLMDALEIDQAHIVGASMGGMIAQIVAADYPERVKSLVSLMSTSGKPTLPGPSPRVLRGLLRRRPRRNAERGIAETIEFLRLIGSPGYPTSDAELRAKVERAVRRRHHPDGWTRHLIAVQAAQQPGPGAPAHSRPDAGHARGGRSAHSRCGGPGHRRQHPRRAAQDHPRLGPRFANDAVADSGRRNRRPLRGDRAPAPRRLIARQTNPCDNPK